MNKSLVMAGAASLIASASANAVTIYAMNNLTGGGTGPNALVSFDSANPAGWAAIGSSGVNGGFTGLDFAGVGGGLFGYVGFGTGVTPGLYSMNVNTGAATQVGNLSGIALQDLAWNPVTNKMYGVNSVSNVATLYEVNLVTGGVTAVGNFAGLPATNLEVGLACDALGNFYVHDIASDQIFKSAVPNGLVLNMLYTLPNNTNFSQGMTIDWSGNGLGYHASIGNSPAFWSELYTFNTNGGAYNLVGNFGTGTGTFPTFEGGDLAIAPIPAPGALALLGLAGLATARRRRR